MIAAAALRRLRSWEGLLLGLLIVVVALSLARSPVYLGVGNIVPSVDNQAEWKRDVNQSQPKCARIEDVPLAQRKQVEPDGS